jgi:hypothetical protein
MYLYMMNKETTIEDPSVLRIIKTFTNKMINQYMKMYTDFKFDLELIDVTSNEGYDRVSDSVRRDYDYVLFLKPNQVIPGIIYLNEETPFYPKDDIRAQYMKNPYEIGFYEFTELLREDLKMLGINLDSVSFGQTFISCPVDYKLSSNSKE